MSSISGIYTAPICIYKNLIRLRKQAKRVFRCAKLEYSFEMIIQAIFLYIGQ